MPSKVQQLKLTGLSVDLPPYHEPPNVWTRAANIEMFDGFPRRARGFGRYAEAGGGVLHPPRHIENLFDNGTSQWVYCGDDAVAVTDGSVHTDITGGLVFDSTGLDAPWSSGVINNRGVFNNITGEPFYFVPGTLAALPLPDWPVGDRAGALRVFREFMIAMDITSGGVRDSDLFRWSDAAPPNDVPQSWTPGIQSLAGSASAAFTAGALVDGLALRSQFYLYKAHATYVLSLIGGAFVMQQQPLFATFGALTRNCVVEWRGSHIVLTDGDVIIHNGVEAQSLIDKRIRSAIFDRIDGDNYDNSFLALDKERAEIWVCVPEEGNEFPNIAAVWSIEDNQWGVRDLGGQWPHGREGVVDTEQAEPIWSSRTTQWDTDGTRWSESGSSPAQQKMLFADFTNTSLQNIDFIDSFDGVDPLAELERTGLDLGLPDRYKLVTRIWPRIEGPNGSIVQVRVGGQEGPELPIVWDDYQDYVIGETSELSVVAAGRLIAIGMRSTTSATWRSPSFDIEVQEQGGW